MYEQIHSNRLNNYNANDVKGNEFYLKIEYILISLFRHTEATECWD